MPAAAGEGWATFRSSLVGPHLQIHIEDVGFNPRNVPREKFLSLVVTFDAAEIASFSLDPSKLRVTITGEHSVPVSVFRRRVATGASPDIWVLNATQLSHVIHLSQDERFFEFRVLDHPTTETFDMHIEGVYFGGAPYHVPRITFRKKPQRGSFV